jgi:hypothetical protein
MRLSKINAENKSRPAGKLILTMGETSSKPHEGSR